MDKQTRYLYEAVGDVTRSLVMVLTSPPTEYDDQLIARLAST